MITVIVHSNPIVVTDTFAGALHFLLSFSYFFFFNSVNYRRTT